MTGILSNTYDVATLLHRYGALSFWDYATAGMCYYIEFDIAYARVPCCLGHDGLMDGCLGKLNTVPREQLLSYRTK